MGTSHVEAPDVSDEGWRQQLLSYRVPVPKQVSDRCDQMRKAKTWVDVALGEALGVDMPREGATGTPLAGARYLDASASVSRRRQFQSREPIDSSYTGRPPGEESVQRISDLINTADATVVGPARVQLLKKVDPERLWDYLEHLIRTFRGPGTRRRFNLEPDGKRDHTGRAFVKALPSDIVRDGEIFDVCRALAPEGFAFTGVQVNRFKRARQCQQHVDKNNKGDSLWAMMGSCTGGALRLATGQRFWKKRTWCKHDGSKIPHKVEHFKGERLSVVLFTSKETETVSLVDDCGGGCDCGEPVERIDAVKKSYRNVGRREKQEELFPALQKEIVAKRLELHKGVKWPDAKARWSQEYYLAMQEATKDKIGGTPQEQDEFFAKVIGPHPEQFWLEGCAAPCVSGTVISFKLKPGAKPVARQPIPMSPYDELRTEYHLEEWMAQGKVRKVDTARERLPEWSTPVFVVDQDAKGLLGRMVCAYGPVNKCLEISAPSLRRILMKRFDKRLARTTTL